jgi:hypothetical protein
VSDKAQKMFDFISENADKGIDVTIAVGDEAYLSKLAEATKDWPRVKVVHSQYLEPNMICAYVDNDFWSPERTVETMAELLLPRPGYQILKPRLPQTEGT